MLSLGEIPAAERSPDSLQRLYRGVREQTEKLIAPLSSEDCVVQSMPDVSPTKWHLAHTSWFFETFVLLGPDGDGKAFHPAYQRLFNSYYNTVGDMHPRPERGLLSRPSREQVQAYRRSVDARMVELIARLDGAAYARVAGLVELGLHHEQQHQELILTDIKHVLSCNPLRPVYRASDAGGRRVAQAAGWVRFDEGLRWIGHAGAGFSFDNELPNHPVYVSTFEMASREVTAGEFLEFIQDDGYRRPELWLSDGWALVQAHRWEAPMYWRCENGAWLVFTLAGEHEVNPADPVCHVSHYEADAFARWAGARLPTEFEWETAAHDWNVEESGKIEGNFADDGLLHPCAPEEPLPTNALSQMYGGVWEWTRSPYVAYPGYQSPDGALGEYNGKFMSNQMVLRGGSCATPRSHIRRTYRNFFPPDARWQFTGLRLARDVASN